LGGLNADAPFSSRKERGWDATVLFQKIQKVGERHGSEDPRESVKPIQFWSLAFDDWGAPRTKRLKGRTARAMRDHLHRKKEKKLGGMR